MLNKSQGYFFRWYGKYRDAPWRSDIACTLVAIYLMEKHQFSDKVYQREFLKKGQVLFSVSDIEAKHGLTRQQIRTALKKLETSEFMIIHKNAVPTKKGMLVTLCDYTSCASNGSGEEPGSSNFNRENNQDDNKETNETNAGNQVAAAVVPIRSNQEANRQSNRHQSRLNNQDKYLDIDDEKGQYVAAIRDHFHSRPFTKESWGDDDTQLAIKWFDDGVDIGDAFRAVELGCVRVYVMLENDERAYQINSLKYFEKILSELPLLDDIYFRLHVYPKLKEAIAKYPKKASPAEENVAIP